MPRLAPHAVVWMRTRTVALTTRVELCDGRMATDMPELTCVRATP